MAEKRRRNGEGTIYQRPDGYWSAQIDIGKNSEGRRIRRSIVGSSYEEVASQFDIERGRIKMGGGLVPNKTSVGEWLDLWFISVESKLRPTTRDSYITTIKRIKKHIGGSKLSSISFRQITIFYNVLQEEGLSSATIMKTHVVLKRAMDQAVLAHLILFNLISMIDHPKAEHKDPVVLTITGQRKLAEHLEECTQKGIVTSDLLLFILETGMRAGEAIAFRWDNIIESEGHVYFLVNQTAARVYDQNPESELKTKIIVGSTKTAAGKRYIPATMRALEIVARLREKGLDKYEYVFSTKSGNMLQTRNIRRFLDNCCKRLGIKKVTIHGLRHTFSTRLYEAQIPAAERAKIMGHTDSRTTDKLYVTIDIEGIRKAIDNYEKAVEKMTGGNNLATTMTSSLQEG